MKLINTSTGLLEEFIGRNIPKYVILSHTWEEEEVSFKDMSDPSCHNKKGYQKISKTSQIASQAGYSYIWIDTCCIDKSSSADLSEAINSMYRWYQRSEICYVFLSDLSRSASLDSELQNCRWFTRGWTLQELIAPENIFFFDQDWNNRGSKRGLVGNLWRITGIDEAILQHSRPLSSVAVAQKMSWAAYRETTRIEDTAYCLLGIFDVNLPLLYGEEEKAFRRLQEEIIKSTADLSIFAWRLPPTTTKTENPRSRVFCGVLAESPLAFSMSKSLTKLPANEWHDFSISKIGIKTQVQLRFEPIPGKQAHRYILPLDCFWDPKVSIGVRLRKCGPDQFLREDPWNFLEYKISSRSSTDRMKYLLTELPEVHLDLNSQISEMNLFIAQRRLHVLQIRSLVGLEPDVVWPRSRYDNEDQVFFVTGDSTWDSAVLKLASTITYRDTDQRDTKFRFETMFYGLGWSSLDDRQLQCTLVNYESFASALNKAQSQILDFDHYRDQVLTLLIYHQIPKTSAVLFEVSGKKLNVMISFTPVLVSDPTVCQNRFWRIDFSVNVYGAKDLPEIETGTWKVKADE